MMIFRMSTSFIGETLKKSVALLSILLLMQMMKGVTWLYQMKESSNVSSIDLSRSNLFLVITDSSYPSRSAFSIAQKIIEEMKNASISQQMTSTHDGIKRFQDPKNADNLLRIKQNLEETQAIMVENLQKAMIREGTLEELVEKSQNISESTKVFVRNTKKLSKCCSYLIMKLIKIKHSPKIIFELILFQHYLTKVKLSSKRN